MHRLRYLASASALLLVCGVSRAQEQCDVEVKLLLAPAAAQDAISALKAKSRSLTRVYFFDTDALDLLSQGVIVRLRQSADAELTIKIRHPEGKAFSDPSGGREKFKCEVDFIGGQGRPSYSLQTSYDEGRPPDSGIGLFRSLSAPQKELLKQAQVSIDWNRVKRIADIQSTVWRSKSIPGFDRLDLELWQFAGGQILELSTRGAPDTGPSIADALRKLADAKGLPQSPTQLPKTSSVLRTITHASVQ